MSNTIKDGSTTDWISDGLTWLDQSGEDNLIIIYNLLSLIIFG